MFSVYFGDKASAVSTAKTLQHDEVEAVWPQNIEQPRKFLFLNQVHGVEGVVVDHDDDTLFGKNGDFVATNVVGLGVGVITGDCLPIAILDDANKACAIVHAGWRGAVAGVIENALFAMEKSFGTDPKVVRVVFGPSAKACCYEVGNEFLDLLGSDMANQTVAMDRDRILFDLPLFCCIRLEEAGVRASAIDFSQNQCTVCNERFCSYRRDSDDMRQISIVTLW